MKRYIAFAFDNYYPGGGTSDIVDQTDDLEEAKLSCIKTKRDCYEVYDNMTEQIVWEAYSE